MSAEYSREHCKIVVGKILQTIGWHSINTTPLEVLTDILSSYVKEIAKTTAAYAAEFGQTEPNLDHLGLAFQELGVNLGELEEYVTYVNFVPPPHPVPKYPIPRENNLNFLKPGSKEVVTRPIHINEHLPPMYPLMEEQNDTSTESVTCKKEISTEDEKSEDHQFKKPAEVGNPEFRKSKKEEEGGRPTREITSVMMTTSGFLSPAREGKLPEAKAPAPPPEPPKPPSPIPVPELAPIKKKPEKKRDKINKDFFKPIQEERPPKKVNSMKDILTMKRAKAVAANAAAAAATQSPTMPPGLSNLQPLPSSRFIPPPFADMKLPPLIPHAHTHHKSPQKSGSSSFNNALAAAKAKTEKLNTTITPIMVKSEPKFQPPTPHPVDKLANEPDKKKINILKKISKHERQKQNMNAQLMHHDIVSKINLSSDITIEPIHPSMSNRPMLMRPDSFFDNGSPPGTPPTPRTPDILPQTPPFVVKEKRKRKEKSDKTPKEKRPRKQTLMPQPHFLDPEFLEMSLGRPKTPDAHLLMRNKPTFPPSLPPTNPPLPFPFLPTFGGPGLIPTLTNPFMPFASPIPDFGKTPYFPPMPPKPEPRPKASPKPKEVIKPEPVEVIPPPVVPTPPPPREPSPLPPKPPTPTIPEVLEEKPVIKAEEETSVVSEESTPKKSKEHKKEKKDKTKKKNKKEKFKDKLEKKKLKEGKKEKLKIKKEKKKKLSKEELPPEVPVIPKILLKVNSPSPRPETPDSLKKINIKPVVKREDSSPDRKQRDPSPGLAQISALVVGPPKHKSPAPPPPEKPSPPPSASEPLASPTTTSRTPGRPRIHPLKPKPAPKPKKIEQPFVKVDAEGNEVWICPACGQQDDGRPMIGCDGCDAWYHWVCVGIQVPPDENENWYCKPCLAKKNEDFQDKKKKRKKKDKSH
ncbi:transcription initiation factor TFIID subunit 3 [Anthonomus grandis grandis]|uniref:transcription initiation factor TFIID subunit 3 n=1 Tax=Anthonomus grandis grandis TaxID=2921223 RepID=UPI002166467B|nr:transcription initiation factor TFIID subunit 3 [Anthonomus grandis grandis]